MNISRGAALAVAVAGTSLASAVPASAGAWHTVAQYHLEHASPLLSTSNRLNGTLHDVVPTPGRYGRALWFNGRTSYGLVQHNNAFNPGARNFRISVWIKTTDRNVDEQDWDIIKYGYSATSPGLFTLEYYDNGTVSFGVKGDEKKVQIQGRPNLANGRWHQVVGMKTATAVYLYVDGRLVASKRAVVGNVKNSNNFVIGAHRGPSPSEHFHGGIDEVVLQTWS